MNFYNFFIISLLSVTFSVDRNNFKTCKDSGFCSRHRNLEPSTTGYVAVFDTNDISWSEIKMRLIHRENSKKNVPLSLTISTHEDRTLRLKIDEEAPIKARYKIPLGDVLLGEPKPANFHVLDRTAEHIIFEFYDTKILVNLDPFRLDVVIDGQPIVVVNGKNLLKIEHYRKKENKEETTPHTETSTENLETQNNEEDGGKEDAEVEDDEPGLWEETFKSHTDTKPFGPSSVGLDISFPGFEHVYGIPEHADSFALRSTKNSDPYRLYNLDVFEYETDNPMALYGSVPLMLAHNTKNTVGLFWLNAAETWVDIGSNIADKNMFSKLVNMMKYDKEVPQIDTHWISESGIIDVFLLLGPRPTDVFRQYAALTGTTPLPPLFAIAYHQCRWNYNDEEDVQMINQKFDEHDIPLDVIWLDIEHTDGKRYLTWDSSKFPHPEEMVKKVVDRGRKMVTIANPHWKRDDNYHVYKDALTQDLLVKHKEGHVFEGWCWPGSSSWGDFTNELVRQYWANRLSLDSYKGSSLDVHIWNDMNEPSVFNGPEITMFKDLVHIGGWEHRDIHNIFGHYVQRATFEGLKLRSDEKLRPFVLSRAIFAGSQRYGAIWTGDNSGEWSHLKISIPMLLSLNIVGITFSGADVGGFFKNPDPELLTRWYQAGAFQPFFRAHAHLDTRRREPWLQPPEHLRAIRNAIRLRYMLLPYWYTLFFISEKSGEPVMRPMWVEFPADASTFSMDDQHLVGPALLVKPIVEAGVTGTEVYLPGPNEVWYEIDSSLPSVGGKSVYVPVDLNKVPIFLRGGYIVPIRERIRRSATLSINDPFTLIVILDIKGKSAGDLYFDDFQSYDYKNGAYVHQKFIFENNILTTRNQNPNSSFKSLSWIERIVILGVNKPLSHGILKIEGKEGISKLETQYIQDRKTLIVRKPATNIDSNFTITFR